MSTLAPERPRAALRQALTEPALQERAYRGRARRRLLGLISFNDWSKETQSQSWLRFNGPASPEQRREIAGRLHLDPDELIHPLLTENVVALLRFDCRSTAAAREELARIDERWQRQGRRYAPWNGEIRQWRAVVEAAALFEPLLAKLKVTLDRAQVEELLAAPVAPLNRERAIWLYGWSGWLNEDALQGRDAIDLQRAAGKRTSERLSQLAAELKRADVGVSRRARSLFREVGLTRDLETFLPYRDLLLANAERARTIFGWLDGPQSSEWHLTELQPGQQEIIATVAEALQRRSELGADGPAWLLTGNGLLGGRSPKELLQEDVLAHWQAVIAAAEQR